MIHQLMQVEHLLSDVRAQLQPKEDVGQTMKDSKEEVHGDGKMNSTGSKKNVKEAVKRGVNQIELQTWQGED